MANRFVYKPWASYRNQEGKDVTKTFPTYAKLRRAMTALMNDSINDVVEVTRTRRGKWGQWFEVWERNNYTNKITIVKQTWL